VLYLRQRLSSRQAELALPVEVKGKTVRKHSLKKHCFRTRCKKLQPVPIQTMNHEPRPGEFCRESELGSRKADFIISLHDQRLLALEYKVSNSELNSIKRLNNDAAVKRQSG
jgi:hypothetical protein